MSFPSRIAALFLVTVFLLAAVVGCGDTVIDDAKTEGALKQNIESSQGKNVAAVECPSGVEVEAGATFECTVQLVGGEEETATLRIINEDADIEVTDLRADK